MRIPKYLSPTSLAKWHESEDHEEFYLQYLAETRPPRIPQTQPMAVGSAFDAHIKSYYHERLFGKGSDPRFEFETIFEEQVEKHNRDWAHEAGLYVFEAYRVSGALNDLLSELQESDSAPRFEFKLEETINDVPLLGKPDLYYIHKEGSPIILDWKVNGFCSKYPKSPNKGYLRIRDGWTGGVPSRNAGAMHKAVQPMRVNGVIINIAMFLEDVDISWATQLSTYAWLCGAKVGEEFVCALDQIVAKPDVLDKPLLRIAEHRCLTSGDFQRQTLTKYTELWAIVNSNHIFRHLSFEESAHRCEMLDQQYAAFGGEGDSFIREMTGRS